MAKLNWRTIGWLALSAVPMAASAQFSFNATSDPTTAPQSALGGVPAMDLIRLDGLGPGVPLRKGNVVPGSERVQLNGQSLKSGTDYGMDYVSGVVYVQHPIKPGDSLTVFYHYDDKAPQQAAPINGINALKLDLIPGQFGMIAGMGMAERNPDGSVSTSNLFGFNSNFAMGSSKLNGLFLFDQQKKVASQSLMGYQGAQSAQPQGKSDLIVQNLTTSIGKGNFSASYQDISRNFTDFGSALAAGYDAKVVDQLQKEKGLKRMSFGFNNLQVGSMNVSQNFKSIQDGNNELDWRSFGLKQGGLDFSYSSQYVSQGFTRFNDIAEADRAQLAKETGMTRQNLAANLTQKFGKLSFSDNTIADGTGQSLYRRELAFDNSKFKLDAGEQNVSATFARIGSVLPNEQAMYGPDLGVHRQWMALDANLDKNLQPIHFAMTDLSTSSGGFQSTDFSAGGKAWSLEHSNRTVDPGFTAFNAIRANAANDLKAISNMYQKDPIALRPQDAQIFLSANDIGRDFNRLTLSPSKDFGLMFQRMTIKSAGQDSFVDTATLNAKNLAFKFSHESLASNLNMGSLMLFEQDRLGTMAGLNRTDVSLNWKLGGQKTFALSQTDASVGSDGLTRQTASYADKNISIQAGMRNVGANFAAAAAQLVDPEKTTLPALAGFKESDFKLSWQVNPTMKLEAYNFDASSDTLDQQKKLQSLLFDWKPDKTSSVSFYHLINNNYDPTQILFANNIDRLAILKDFGKLGKFSFTDEKQSNDGSQNSTPGSDTQSFTYQTQLNKTTSLQTQQTTTKYDNGEKEDTSTNTISTSLTKQLGVSVSDVKVNRPGTDQDQNKQNLGFWIDFGHGIRFNYGYARQVDLNGIFNQNQVSLTGGQVGDWKVGNAGYTSNFWSSSDRNQAVTQFALQTVKPIRFGLIKDVTVNIGWDTAADQSVWLKENKIFSFAGKVGSNQIGFDYHSQILSTNQRGIDRGFSFKTDPSDKKWLRASVFYKGRTMPDGSQIMIRNMSTTARILPGVELTNSVITNPEQPNGNAMLGSVPIASRKNSWKLEYKPLGKQDSYHSSYTFGANWDELFNDANRTLTRTAGTTFKVDFANSKNVKPDDMTRSSMTLYYGLEQNDTTSLRRLAQRYSLAFDQRPGENQTFSFLLGNISYEHSIADGFHRDNWTLGLNYQLKF